MKKLKLFGQLKLKECARFTVSQLFFLFYVVVLQKSPHCHFLKKNVCVTEITIPGETSALQTLSHWATSH